MADKSLISYTFAKTAEVLVVDVKVKFTIHPEIIGERSPVLKAALAKRWNPEHKAIELPDDDPAAFNDYLKCIYLGIAQVGRDDHDDPFIELMRAYVLADKLGDLQTTNDIIDTIIHRSDVFGAIPDGDCVSVVFTQTTDSSPLRRLVVDYYIHEGTMSLFEQANLDQVPASFLWAVANAYRRLKEDSTDETGATVNGVFSRTVSQGDKCEYHQHDESVPEYKDSGDELG